MVVLSTCHHTAYHDRDYSQPLYQLAADIPRWPDAAGAHPRGVNLALVLGTVAGHAALPAMEGALHGREGNIVDMESRLSILPAMLCASMSVP
jgi:hypothetical protein